MQTHSHLPINEHKHDSHPQLQNSQRSNPNNHPLNEKQKIKIKTQEKHHFTGSNTEPSQKNTTTTFKRDQSSSGNDGTEAKP